MKPHILLTLAVLLATACSGPAPQPATDARPAAATSEPVTGAAAVTCDDVNATIAGLKDRFASANGVEWDYDFLDGGDHDWDMTFYFAIKMTNADLCTITSWNGDARADLHCSWRQPDEAAANATAQVLVARLQACLPDLEPQEDKSGSTGFVRSFKLPGQDDGASLGVYTNTMPWPPGGFSEAAFDGETDINAWIERRNALAREVDKIPRVQLVTYFISAWETPCEAVDRLISNAVDYGKLYGVAPDEIDSTSIAAIDPCMTGWTRRDLPIGEPLSETFPDSKGVPMTVTHPYIKAVEYTGPLKGKPTRLRAYADDNGWVWLDATPN